MWKDPIVEEVRRARETYAARFNHDLEAICRDLRERQAQSGRRVISFPPKRIGGNPAEKHLVRALSEE